MEYFYRFFVACLFVGIVFLIGGFIFFGNLSRSKNAFFVSGLSLLMPPLISLALFTVDCFQRLNTSGDGRIPFELIIFEGLLTVVFLATRFGKSSDRVVRNTLLGFSIFFVLQLLVLLFFAGLGGMGTSAGQEGLGYL